MRIPLDSHKVTKHYSSDYIRTQGIYVWKSMFEGLWSNYSIILNLIYRDFSVRFKQSLLGYLWALIPPLVAVLIFSILSSQKVIPGDNLPLPYPIYALWNLTLWQLFSSSLINCTSSLSNAGNLITKINFPKETIVIAGIGQPLLEFAIRLIPLTILMIWYRFTPALESLIIPLFLVPLLLLAIGLGFFLSILNLAIRDISNAIGIILTFGTFLSPILYPQPETYPFILVYLLNPFSHFLIPTQDLIVNGELKEYSLLFVTSTSSILTFLIGWRIFYLTIPRVTERA